MPGSYELSDGNETRTTDTGSSPLRLTVDQDLPEQDQEWSATAWVDSTTPVEIDATFAISVVEDGEPPRQLSKLGPR